MSKRKASLVEALKEGRSHTWTYALQPGSPAIDAANPAGCFDTADVLLVTDQRGHPLPWDGDADGTVRCDIGAYEAPPEYPIPADDGEISFLRGG